MMGDSQWPSTPGKPSTFSPEYWEVHALLVKKMNKEPLSADEAELVWSRVHALASAIPEGQILLTLSDHLSVETHTGQRCSVCGRHASEHYDCRFEC